MIASISVDGVGAALTLTGGTTKAVFEQYVRDVLALTLEPNQIVVLDNLGAHRSPVVRDVIEARGAQLWYLPAYSPDLSPIELAFSKLKGILRRIGARTREALEAAIAAALAQVTAEECRGWFAHCGYHIQCQ